MRLKLTPLMEAPEDSYIQNASGIYTPPEPIQKESPTEVSDNNTVDDTDQKGNVNTANATIKDEDYQDTVERLKEKYPDIAAEIDRSVQLTDSFGNNFTEWVEDMDRMGVMGGFLIKFCKGYIFNYLLQTKNLSLDDKTKYGWLTCKSFYQYTEPEFKYVWNILTSVTDNSRRFFGDQRVSWKDFTYDNQGVNFFPANIAGKQKDQYGNSDPNTIWGKVELLQAKSGVGSGNSNQKMTHAEATRHFKSDLKLDDKQIEDVFKTLASLSDYD